MHHVYHSGQIYFLMQDYRKAMAEYERSTTLDANFLFAKIQHAVACYRLGEIATANDAFDVLVSAHGDAADVHYFYGEILLDQGKVEEAQKAFERASRINPSLALPLLNRVCQSWVAIEVFLSI